MMITEKHAMELLRSLLMHMHTVKGARWFVVPGGLIADSVAERFLARSDVQPHDASVSSLNIIKHFACALTGARRSEKAAFEFPPARKASPDALPAIPRRN